MNQYKYANIMWVVGTNPPRLLVGGGKGEREEEMGIRDDNTPASEGFDEIVRAIRVDYFRLPRRMSEPELQDWIDGEPERLERRLKICREEVEEDFITDDGEVELSI